MAERDEQPLRLLGERGHSALHFTGSAPPGRAPWASEGLNAKAVT